jgi:hypothetical protein
MDLEQAQNIGEPRVAHQFKGYSTNYVAFRSQVSSGSLLYGGRHGRFKYKLLLPTK